MNQEKEAGVGPPVAVVTAAALVLVLLILTLPSGTFYTTDAGANFLLARRVAEQGPGLTVDLPGSHVSGELLDLSFTALRGYAGSPPPHMFLTGSEDGWMLTYPPLFPHVSALGLKLLGLPGLLLLPALAGLLAALLAAKLETTDRREASVCFLVCLFGTPMLFYSVVFWGHTLGVVCLVGAVTALVRDRPVLAGALASAAVLIRTETAAAAGLLPVAWALAGPRNSNWLRTLAAYAAGAALVAVPMMAFNMSQHEGPLGTHAKAGVFLKSAGGDSVAEGMLRKGLTNSYHFLAKNQRMKSPADGVLAAVIACSAVAAITGPGAVQSLFLALSCLGGVAGIMFALAVPGQYASGLLLVMPAAALAPLALKTAFDEADPHWRWIGLFLLLDFAAVAAIAPPGGWQWGPRYLLPIVPFLAILACKALKTVRRTAVTLLVCSLVMQFVSIRDLRGQLQAQERLVEGLATQQPIMTDVWFLAWQLLPSVVDRAMLYTPGKSGLEKALRVLQRRGIDDLLLASGIWRAEGAGGTTVPSELDRVLGQEGWRATSSMHSVFPTGDRIDVWRITRTSADLLLNTVPMNKWKECLKTRALPSNSRQGPMAPGPG